MNDFREYSAAFHEHNYLMHWGIKDFFQKRKKKDNNSDGKKSNQINEVLVTSIVKKLTGVDLNNLDSIQGAISQSQARRLREKVIQALPSSINIDDVDTVNDVESIISKMSFSEKMQLITLAKNFLKENKKDLKSIKSRYTKGVDYRKGVKYNEPIGPKKR